MTMSASVSFILPVHNAQNWLVKKTEMLLEELSGLAREFQLIIVDDGSTDDTHSVALELTTEFPQVHLIRQPLPYGRQAAERYGLSIATGKFVFIPADSATVSGRDLHHIWKARHDPLLVMVTNQGSGVSPGVRHERVDRGDSANPGFRINARFGGLPSSGIRMIRRDAVSSPGVHHAAGHASGLLTDHLHLLTDFTSPVNPSGTSISQ